MDINKLFELGSHLHDFLVCVVYVCVCVSVFLCLCVYMQIFQNLK